MPYDKDFARQDIQQAAKGFFVYVCTSILNAAMTMLLELLRKMDCALLLCINGAHTPFLDNLMWMLTRTETWIVFYVMATVTLFCCHGRKAWKALLTIALVIAMADTVSSGVIKPAVQRLRPTHNPTVCDQLHCHEFADGSLYRGGKYGFVSSHAANSAATAMMLYFFLSPYYFKHRRRLMAGLAIYVLLLSYTRVYLGVHWPTDILGGWVVAAVICAAACFFLKSEFCTFAVLYERQRR